MVDEGYWERIREERDKTGLIKKCISNDKKLLKKIKKKIKHQKRQQ